MKALLLMAALMVPLAGCVQVPSEPTVVEVPVELALESGRVCFTGHFLHLSFNMTPVDTMTVCHEADRAAGAILCDTRLSTDGNLTIYRTRQVCAVVSSASEAGGDAK